MLLYPVFRFLPGELQYELRLDAVQLTRMYNLKVMQAEMRWKIG